MTSQPTDPFTPNSFSYLEYDQALEEEGRDHLGYKVDQALGFNNRIPDYAMTYPQWTDSVTPKWWQFWKRKVNYSYAAYHRYLEVAAKQHEVETKARAKAQAEERKRLIAILNSEDLPTVSSGLVPVSAPTLVPSSVPTDPRKPRRFRKTYSETKDEVSDS